MCSSDLVAGGPEQQRVAAALGDSQYRLIELAPNMHDYVFPYDMPHLYRVRTVHGYSALQPPSLFWLPAEEKERVRDQLADYIYESTAPGQVVGDFRKAGIPALARFHWRTPTTRAFTVQQRALGQMELEFEPGAAGTLLWTDNYFPGWREIGRAHV